MKLDSGRPESGENEDLVRSEGSGSEVGGEDQDDADSDDNLNVDDENDTMGALFSQQMNRNSVNLAGASSGRTKLPSSS